MNYRIRRYRYQPGRIAAFALIITLMVFLVSRTQFVTAQSTGATPSACSKLLTLVEKNIQKSCNGLDRDQICYGNDAISVKFKDQGGQNPFAKVGDIVPITSITSITTQQLAALLHRLPRAAPRPRALPRWWRSLLAQPRLRASLPGRRSIFTGVPPTANGRWPRMPGRLAGSSRRT